MMPVSLALVPRDGFFCKDGRGWFTSASGRGHAVEWPWPSTILGVLRTACGRAEEARDNKRIEASDWFQRTSAIEIGKALSLRRPHRTPWAAEHLIWPAPLDAIWFEGASGLERLDPQPPKCATAGRDDDAAREALWIPAPDCQAKPRMLPRWWSHKNLVAWLAGETVHEIDDLSLARRLQPHVGIQAEALTADQGVLFSHDVVETLEQQAEWAIGVEAQVPDIVLPTAASMGSDSRPVQLEPLPGAVFEAPKDVIASFRRKSAGLRLMLVTPACFEKGWLPDGFFDQDGQYRGTLAGLGELILRAAFVPRPIAISGWDMAARGPKPTALMAAPGAVYFFERADGRPFDDADARALWLIKVGGRTAEGFGQVVPGVWTPLRSDQ